MQFEFHCRKEMERRQKLLFIIFFAERYEHILFRQTETCGEHGFKERLAIRITEASNLARRSHFDARAWVCALDATERELWGFDGDVVELERPVLAFDIFTKHRAKSKFRKIVAGHFGDERERAARADVELYHFDMIIFRNELHVERSRYLQFLQYRSRNIFRAMNGLDIGALGRENDSRIARVRACIFDVFGNGVDDEFAFLRNTVNFYLARVLDEFRDDDGVIRRNIRRAL